MVTVERIEIFQWLSHLGCKAASAYMKHFHVIFWAAILFVSSSNVQWHLNVLFLICQNAFHASVVTCCPSSAPEWHLCGLMDLRLASLSNSLQDFKYKCKKYKNTYKSKTQKQIWYHLYILMVIKLTSLSSSLQDFKYKEYKITNTSKTQIQL